MVESTKYNTFFDIGIQEDPTKKFAQMRCYIYGNKKKKRVINNEIVLTEEISMIIVNYALMILKDKI